MELSRVPWGGGPWVLPISVVAQGEHEELHDGIFVSHHKEGHAAPRGTAPGERGRDLFSLRERHLIFQKQKNRI